MRVRTSDRPATRRAVVGSNPLGSEVFLNVLAAVL